MKTKLMITAAALVACVVAGMMLLRAPVEKIHATETVAAAKPAAVAVAPVEKIAPVQENNTKAPAAEISAQPEKSSAAAPEKKSAPQKKPSAPKDPLQDPDARVALSLVGADPDAEAYWLAAISDTSLPDNERKDLMEDLNEDGLSDPKHPGPEDLPLILNRIALIERIAPNADPFMQEPLGEAYKDLKNLLAGEPVK